ncbi:hypothetical protein KGP45_02785 [Pediococcus ethanolidurans]|uniref:hypothetical protein n=1 Tax=Pediococcus ethanolidurans TaxID=319653 RepID=UPI001C1EE889|nr:hypothetical protein [Pediococcus ethanolidurans]MBU7563056.1 hypothetical protein [Pediococcus ethanolidurans]
MKKVYKKSPVTDQSKQDKTNSNFIIQPKNGTVKPVNYCLVKINITQLGDHFQNDISYQEAKLIKDLVSGKEIQVLTGDSIQKSIDHLVDLGIFKLRRNQKNINSHTAHANSSEKGVKD